MTRTASQVAAECGERARVLTRPGVGMRPAVAVGVTAGCADLARALSRGGRPPLPAGTEPAREHHGPVISGHTAVKTTAGSAVLFAAGPFPTWEAAHAFALGQGWELFQVCPHLDPEAA